jgi:Uncharacterized conserved protein
MEAISQNSLNRDEFKKGIDEFNRRQFYECHETLEKVWQEYPESDRELIQGIIQVSVGYYHLLRGNRNGALKLLCRGLDRVRKFPHGHFGLQLGPFVEKVAFDLRLVEGAPNTDGAAFEIPTIEFISHSPDC